MSPEPYYADELVTLYHGDCLHVLPSLAHDADLVLTDPPYGIPAGSAVVRSAERRVEDWADAAHNVRVVGWHRLVRLAQDAALVEFCGNSFDGEDATRAAHVDAGLTPWRRYALVKQAPAPTPRPTFSSGWELAIISIRGKRQWYGGGATPDRWVGMTPNRLNSGSGHPTEKPLSPMLSLIEALSARHAVVLDPFTGSGTTLVAASTLGRRSIGIELDEGYCEIAAKRLAQGVLDFGAVS